MRKSPIWPAGFTMAEMLIALSLAVSLLGLLTATVSKVLMAEGGTREHLEGLQSLAAFAERFRGDVHAATSATSEKANSRASRLRLDSAGEVVEYEIDPTGLRRTLSFDGMVAQRELFALSGMKVLGWNDDAQATRRISTRLGRLTRGAADDETVAAEFSIDAALGGVRPAVE